MAENSDRQELERRLDQARRMSKSAFDAVTKERLDRLIRLLEDRLR